MIEIALDTAVCTDDGFVEKPHDHRVSRITDCQEDTIRGNLYTGP